MGALGHGRSLTGDPRTRAPICHTYYHIENDCLHSFPPPPWGVPNRRKPRGSRRDCLKLYDPHEGYLFSSRADEVMTQNRYSPLNRYSKDPDYYKCESKTSVNQKQMSTKSKCQ